MINIIQIHVIFCFGDFILMVDIIKIQFMDLNNK